jgi:hypothetical protein
MAWTNQPKATGAAYTWETAIFAWQDTVYTWATPASVTIWVNQNQSTLSPAPPPPPPPPGVSQGNYNGLLIALNNS